MTVTKRYSATDENLFNHGLEPAMRWLIAVALDRTTITYGTLADKLEDEANFSRIFDTRIGAFVGELMHRIQSVEPNAPLINVLVVAQKDFLPGDGASIFLSKRFDEPKLNSYSSKYKYPKLWKYTVHRAAEEVYAYPEEKWKTIYLRLFKNKIDSNSIEAEREKRKVGTERDGMPYGRAGGEGSFHKALRLWVRDNPNAIHPNFARAFSETEVDLDSGDRIDVTYTLPKKHIVLEVKSRLSNEADLRRGVFQCVKYRAVRAAMDVRDDAEVIAYLVTENVLPGEIAALLKHFHIRHFLAPLDRD